MVVMRDDDHSDEKQLRELAVQTRAHPDWDVNQRSEPFEHRIAQSTAALESEYTVEYWFDHVATDGVLRLRMPAVESRMTAAQGVLSQALDHRQESNPEMDPFLEQLISAHAKISEVHETEYTEPMSDAASIIALEVPFEYCTGEVDEALTSISKASMQIQQLHSEVLSVLSNPLSP